MNIDVSGFHFQEPFWIRFSQKHSVSHNCYCLHEWLIGLCDCRAASLKLSASSQSDTGTNAGESDQATQYRAILEIVHLAGANTNV